MLKKIPTVAIGVRSNGYVTQLNSTRELRKLLSIEKGHQYKKLSSQGVVPYIVEFLKDEDKTDLQFEGSLGYN
ncbi:hypothetical protein PFDG_05240 [Plasmodium falciparum Dd2]|uniref:Uncharacterized protein n=1 Tax=Plasmodium falciparum (isolate Dd2) TaxID=57267 RepID=A0A0L7MA03_PLAF4|nr:hypothetical protein PFDG_05240 [Plasmodium falciparum Dd2]